MKEEGEYMRKESGLWVRRIRWKSERRAGGFSSNDAHGFLVVFFSYLCFLRENEVFFVVLFLLFFAKWVERNTSQSTGLRKQSVLYPFWLGGFNAHHRLDFNFGVSVVLSFMYLRRLFLE